MFMQGQREGGRDGRRKAEGGVDVDDDSGAAWNAGVMCVSVTFGWWAAVGGGNGGKKDDECDAISGGMYLLCLVCMRVCKSCLKKE